MTNITPTPPAPSAAWADPPRAPPTGRDTTQSAAFAPPAPTPAERRHAIAQAFAVHIRTHLGSPATRMSVLSYGLVTARKLEPTAAELADLDMIAAIDAWETTCVEARNAALADDTPTPPEAWPPPPAGLAAFLTDF